MKLQEHRICHEKKVVQTDRKKNGFYYNQLEPAGLPLLLYYKENYGGRGFIHDEREDEVLQKKGSK
jgi:hypothetical protein